MIAATSAKIRVLLYEGEGSHALDSPTRFSLTRTLLEKGYAVTTTRAGAAVSGSDGSVLVVLGRFTEAKPAEADSVDGNVKVHFRELAGLDAAGAVELVDAIRGVPKATKTWKPWFPVIDYGRCTNCMQCLSFCLFDVYSVSTAGKITVQNENNCKTDCPACSRVCPEVAILFPKYKSGPINGDEINPDDLRREAMKVDISSLLGGDIYAALRDRSVKAQSRFSKERDEDRALKERQRCLSKLQESLEIPMEVLASLPSVDQIRAKAEQAKMRAAEAVNMNAR